MSRKLNGCINGWMDGWLGGWMDGYIYIHTFTFLFIYLYFETEFRSLPRLECNGMISAHRNLRLLDSGNSSASAS